MRLTKLHKTAFVTSVMNDVPVIDYQKELVAVVRQDELTQAAATSKHLVAILKDEALRFLVHNGYQTYYPHSCFSGSGLGSLTIHSGFKLSEEAQVTVKELIRVANKQGSDRDSLRQKITGAIEGCSTLKQAIEVMPEFAKYLPDEETKTQFLPAISNLVAELTLAGWPKEKTPSLGMA